MRVTHVITRLIIGGAQENTLASVLGLRTKPGMDVQLLSGPTLGPEGSLESVCADQPGLLTIIPELVRPVHPWKDLLAFQQLCRVFRNHPPDIVHTHSGKAGFLGRMAAARTGVPIIIHTIHGPSFGAFQGALANCVFRAAERRAGKVTSHFAVVANAMRDQYLAAGIGRPTQFTTIFSGFDLAPFLNARNDSALRARLGLSADDIVIGKIARLFKLKGHDDLFAIAAELVKRCPRIKFLLVGDGIWREKFETRANALGLQNSFKFTGLVPPAEIPGLIGIMDIVVHLSRREGLARALPQALAAARPVVAYDCDGAAEVCLDNQTGFLVPPGNRPALMSSIVKLAEDAELRRKFGVQGQNFVKERFSVQSMVEALYALYLRLAPPNESVSVTTRSSEFR